MSYISSFHPFSLWYETKKITKKSKVLTSSRRLGNWPAWEKNFPRSFQKVLHKKKTTKKNQGLMLSRRGASGRWWEVRNAEYLFTSRFGSGFITDNFSWQRLYGILSSLKVLHLSGLWFSRFPSCALTMLYQFISSTSLGLNLEKKKT